MLTLPYIIIALLVAHSHVGTSINFHNGIGTGFGTGSLSLSGRNRGSTVRPTSQNIKPRELRQLLNSEGTKLRPIKRPHDGVPKILSYMGGGNHKLSHSAVEIQTTHDNNYYTVHKGANFGTEKGGNNVITDSKHQSEKWRVNSEFLSVPPCVKVNDLIPEGGRDYGLLTDNCHTATKALTDYGKKEN